VTGGDVTGGLRVAQVVCTDAFAGVERYIVTLSRGLAERGCDVTVVGGARGQMLRELAGSSVRWLPAASTAEAVRRLAGLRGLELVHAHMTAAELAATLSWPLHRAPLVCTRHFAQRRGSSPAARLLGTVLTRTVPVQLAISEFVRRSVEGESVVVRPGVASVPKVPDGEREPVVLLAQRLESEKRTELALRIWARSGLAERGWTMQLAGDGAQRDRLTRLAADLGVADSCRFLGAREDVPELLARASLFLATRPDEPFGLSVVEAMATGTPVLAAAGGGHDETVGLAEGAALFAADDLDAAAALLRELAGDADRLRRYGRALRAIQQREFTVDRQVEQTLACYRDVLARRTVAS
jgi:glycosyltransferase involved in cell wall biosynthesis